MKNLLILFFIGLFYNSFSQIPDYYVYLVSGGVTVDSAGKKQKPVKQKQLLFKSDKLTLKKGAELTLVDKKGDYFLINTAASDPISKFLENSKPKSGDGVTSKYVQLLFHELLDPSEDFDKFKKKSIAGVWGGVSRGNDCGNKIFPVNDLKTSAFSIRFKWHKTSPSSDYSFEIYDGNMNELFKTNVKDTVYDLNINETVKGKAGIYAWRIISKDGTCEDEIPSHFEVLTPAKEKEQVESLIRETGKESMEQQMQQVDKLEKNGFIHTASSYYASLVNADPGNKALRKSYVVFLLKYGFDEEAKAAWK